MKEATPKGLSRLDDFREAFFMTLIITASMCFSSCAKNERAFIETNPAFQPSPSADTAQLRIPKLTTAKKNEVQEAVKRVFKGSAVIDDSSAPNFILGDFNGDQSQDLAVVLKPVPGMVASLNEELPAWLLRDPLKKMGRDTPTLHVEEHERLLAVIHGYGPNDWRDPQATQTFLLKNAVGSGLQTRTSNEFARLNSGRKLPRLRGDVIGEVLHGTPGYLYFASATYAWYDPQTYRGETEMRPVHSVREMRR